MHFGSTYSHVCRKRQPRKDEVEIDLARKITGEIKVKKVKRKRKREEKVIMQLFVI